MTISRAKDPETVYQEVSDYDLVLVRDGAFASALNRRLAESHFGDFATTPRRYAAGRRERAEDRVAFLQVIEAIDHDWRAIAYAIGNVLQCWEHEGSVDAILAYPAFVDETTREVVEILSEINTTSSRLTKESIEADQDVAVLGTEQFTELERSILPEGFDRVDLFTEEPFDLPDFHIFDSPTDIVTAVLDTITAENADRAAVVLDSGSRYSSLVEAALEAADIPFYGGPGFIDNPHHRGYLRLLRAALRGADTLVADVSPVLSQMGIDVPIAHAEKRLATVDDPGATWLQDFSADIRSRTFAEALTHYEHATDERLELFHEELEALGLAEESITSERIDALAYYLQSFEVPIDRDNEGVLLADAKNSAYVDRPTVFSLGLDQDWTHSPPLRPWVDTAREFDRHIAGFQRLLQSGDRQYYLVQDTSGGRPVTPCLYFTDLLEAEFERFSDLPMKPHRRMPRVDGIGFEPADVDVTPRQLETLSQSSLNSYANCPRDYFFGRLLEGPDKEYFRKGNLLHDFAEFYLEHPDVIRERPIAEIVDRMLAEAAPFVPELEEPLAWRTYRIGVETIMEFLDANAPETDEFLTPSSGWGRNFFAEQFDEPLDSPLTERWFEDASLGVKGKIDLVLAADHLLDYKSGSKRSAYQLVKHAGIDPVSDKPNFQAALYLAYYRSVRPDTPLEFTFFHVLETEADAVVGEADLADTLTTVSYYPFTFDEYVGSRDAFDVLLDGYNDCVETFEDLGFAAYEEIMSGRPFPDTTEKDELRASAFADEFTHEVDTRTADSVDAEKGCDQAIRALNGVRNSAFFREDLDAFEGFVQERLAELNDQLAGAERFPIEGLAGEPNWRRVDHRDLLLEGDGR